MRISLKSVEFLKEIEEFRSQAYPDQGGIWTFGYGTTVVDGLPVLPGMTITPERATILLYKHCGPVEQAIERFVNRKLNQNEFDALVLLTYNIGIRAFRHSSLRKAINFGEPITERLFTMWNKVTIKGKLVKSNGLQTRREREYKLFMTPSN
jgi:lysozyme